jgi:hypothetical protein
MCKLRVLLCVALLPLVLFAQGDRGTITGAISDPAGGGRG